jgi:hypothetical protein
MGESDRLDRLHDLLRPRTYLQLGSRRPDHVARAQCGTVLVAADPVLPLDTLARKPWFKLFATEPETFFATERPDVVFDGQALDLALIDGADSLSRLTSDLGQIEHWSHDRTCAVVLAADAGGGLLSAYARLTRRQRPDLTINLIANGAEPFLLVTGFDPARAGGDGTTAATADMPPNGDALEVDTVALDAALPDFAFEPVAASWQIDPGDWEIWASPGEALRPAASGAERAPRIVFEPPLRGGFRVALEVAAGGLTVMRLRCRSRGPQGERWRDVHLDIGSPGALHHELDRVTLAPPQGGAGFRLELDGALGPGESLYDIQFGVTDNFGNGLPLTEEMALAVRQVQAWEIARPVCRAPFAPSRAASALRPDKRQHGRRDAVIFAWWIPDTAAAEQVARYYLGLLAYHHPDSKFFIGINHGTATKWPEIIRNSGLDVEVCMPQPEITVTSDAAGFLAALRQYERSDEEFDLLWFGHTKGASQQTYDYYGGLRFLQDRTFWARRDAVERAFSDPKIGLFAARYNLYPTYPWQSGAPGWAGELDALRHIYRERYAPLGLNAYETFFALRGAVVRRFCDVVGSEFFRLDPREYGADRWFFEMAFPSIASIQGYEPFIPMDVLGANHPREDLNMTFDMKQNHRLALAELDRWRRDPFDFTPRVVHWDHPAWNRVRGLA